MKQRTNYIQFQYVGNPNFWISLWYHCNWLSIPPPDENWPFRTSVYWYIKFLLLKLKFLQKQPNYRGFGLLLVLFIFQECQYCESEVRVWVFASHSCRKILSKSLGFALWLGIIVPSGWKEVALRWKNSKAKFLFRERIFLFRDRTVVKTERSEVLAVQIEEKEKFDRGMESKPEIFSYSRTIHFSALQIHFFYLWGFDKP